jgi:glycosyltransferase involved in cell wall biosynthesis
MLSERETIIMKKIIFGITSLTLGGAERVLVDLANELSKNKEYEITILTIYGQGELEKQLLPKVKLKSIYGQAYNQLSTLERKFLAPIYILTRKNKIYKKYIENQYDVEIAFLEGPSTRIFACGKEKSNKIAWIHNDIAQVFGEGVKANLKRKIDEKLYNKFSKLIFVSQNNLESFKQTYPENKATKQVIYNYINREQVIAKAEQQVQSEFRAEDTNLLTVARLVPQKALGRLIKVHARLIKENIKHSMYIIGEGPERANLEQLIKSYNCEKTIKLLGKKENPYPYMKEADYICLLSEFEGYGMVLEEAKILNKNILITDTAAKEAVENYEKSKIFENSENGIYEGIKKVLTMPKEEGIEQQEYDNSKIIKQIEQIL